PGRADVPRTWRSNRPAGDGIDRGRDPAADQTDGHADAVPDQRHRPGDRRLRHRLFLADAASPAALHRSEDRPGVHCRRRPFARLPADHPVDRRARPRVGPDRDRRGRRDARAIAAGARARLRYRPGLSDFAAPRTGRAQELEGEVPAAWPAMVAEEKLALWGDVETDALGER